MLRLHVAPIALDVPGGDVVGSGVLKNADTQGFHDTCQAGDEFGGVDSRDVRREHRAARVRYLHPRR